MEEREVAGLRCGEVLAGLEDYLDGALAADVRARVEAHLRGCDVCVRFGGRYAGVVRGLRASLGAPAPLDPAWAERLAGLLDDEG